MLCRLPTHVSSNGEDAQGVGSLRMHGIRQVGNLTGGRLTPTRSFGRCCLFHRMVSSRRLGLHLQCDISKVPSLLLYCFVNDHDRPGGLRRLLRSTFTLWLLEHRLSCWKTLGARYDAQREAGSVISPSLLYPSSFHNTSSSLNQGMIVMN